MKNRIFFIVKLIVVTAAIILNNRFQVEFDRLPVFTYGLLKLGVILLIINIAYEIVIIIYKKTKGLAPKKSDNITVVIKNIYILISFVVGFLYLLNNMGLDLKTLFTSLSIVAAAFVLMFKEYLSPVISGFFLLSSKNIHIGDYVKIGDQKGRIIDISLSKVLFLNDEDDLVTMPNDKVYTNEFINYSKGNVHRVNFNFEISTENLRKIEELENNLIKVLDEYKAFIVDDSFLLRIQELKKDHAVLKFQYELIQMERKLEKEIRKKSIRTIFNSIQQQNIKKSGKS
jgi:small-conductance mechanosensitive channel